MLTEIGKRESSGPECLELVCGTCGAGGKASRQPPQTSYSVNLTRKPDSPICGTLAAVLRS